MDASSATVAGSHMGYSTLSELPMVSRVVTEFCQEEFKTFSLICRGNNWPRQSIWLCWESSQHVPKGIPEYLVTMPHICSIRVDI